MVSRPDRDGSRRAGPPRQPGADQPARHRAGRHRVRPPSHVDRPARHRAGQRRPRRTQHRAGQRRAGRTRQEALACRSAARAERSAPDRRRAPVGTADGPGDPDEWRPGRMGGTRHWLRLRRRTGVAARRPGRRADAVAQGQPTQGADRAEQQTAHRPDAVAQGQPTQGA
ncbi:hypothetical protein, partial [Salinispora arenicola]|uniref:hypothetical protein n=1 Tax=Salinispora arenicola TaxID=168697 RepID=UPI001E57A676